MKKIILFSLLFFIVLTGCNKEINTIEDNIIVLNKETIRDLERGIISGTPLRLDREIHLSEVEKVWGPPHEHHDHEDIQTYVYKIKDRRVVIDEDELKALYIFQIEMKISREEILNKMGNPRKGKKSAKNLRYYKGDYLITFTELDENIWNLIYFEYHGDDY